MPASPPPTFSVPHSLHSLPLPPINRLYSPFIPPPPLSSSPFIYININLQILPNLSFPLLSIFSPPSQFFHGLPFPSAGPIFSLFGFFYSSFLPHFPFHHFTPATNFGHSAFFGPRLFPFQIPSFCLPSIHPRRGASLSAGCIRHPGRPAFFWATRQPPTMAAEGAKGRGH